MGRASGLKQRAKDEKGKGWGDGEEGGWAAGVHHGTMTAGLRWAWLGGWAGWAGWAGLHEPGPAA